MREATFKALTKGKEEPNESRHISEEQVEVNFVKKLQRGSRRFRGNYLSNVFPMVESVIMLPNVLIKINMIKGRNLENGIENKV